MRLALNNPPTPMSLILRLLVLLPLLFISIASGAPTDSIQPEPKRELIVLTGGPALRFNEHGKLASHDMYWFNFVDASEIRLRELQAGLQPGDLLTWLVYKPGYEARSAEMQKDLCSQIQEKATKVGAQLVWFNTTDEMVAYLNKGSGFKRGHAKIASFDYFGHSNKACFLFDYSNSIDGLSVMYLHVNDLDKISPSAFTDNATCKSWGCHSGEMYSEWWKNHFHLPLTGAIGKTDFSHGGLPVLSGDSAKWGQ